MLFRSPGTGAATAAGRRPPALAAGPDPPVGLVRRRAAGTTATSTATAIPGAGPLRRPAARRRDRIRRLARCWLARCWLVRGRLTGVRRGRP